MSLTARALADLRWISAHWDDLAESRLLGTPTPHRRLRLTAERRAEMDAQARAERWERTIDALGASPAPVRVPVLDLMTDLVIDAYSLAHHLSVAVLCPVPPPPTAALSDPALYLSRAAARLTEPGITAEVAAWAYGVTRTMVAAIARSLALVYDGQTLDVECPWCRGVTPEAPAGGARTWRVRDLLGHHPCRHGHPDRRFCIDGCEQQVVIVCENDCEPPSKSVGTWWRGHPCWPLYEWDWLAHQVQRAEVARAEVAPLR